MFHFLVLLIVVVGQVMPTRSATHIKKYRSRNTHRDRRTRKKVDNLYEMMKRAKKMWPS